MAGRSGALATGDSELDSWNAVAGCLLRSARGVSLMEFAALTGDLELYRHLSSRGLQLPARELRCDVTLPRRVTAGARLRIDPQSVDVKVEPL